MQVLKECQKLNNAVIDSEEWLTVWQSTSDLENKYKELKTENKIINDWLTRLEFRIQQLEELKK